VPAATALSVTSEVTLEVTLSLAASPVAVTEDLVTCYHGNRRVQGHTTNNELYISYTMSIYNNYMV